MPVVSKVVYGRLAAFTTRPAPSSSRVNDDQFGAAPPTGLSCGHPNGRLHPNRLCERHRPVRSFVQPPVPWTRCAVRLQRLRPEVLTGVEVPHPRGPRARCDVDQRCREGRPERHLERSADVLVEVERRTADAPGGDHVTQVASRDDHRQWGPCRLVVLQRPLAHFANPQGPRRSAHGHPPETTDLALQIDIALDAGVELASSRC